MKKKILSLLTAFAMVFGILVAPFTTAKADTTDAPNADQSGTAIGATSDTDQETQIILHKMKLKSLEGFPKTLQREQTAIESNGVKYDGGKISDTDLTKFFGDGAEEIAGVTFTYWIFDSEENYNTLKANPTKYGSYDEVKTLLNDAGADIVSTKTGVAIPKSGKITVPANGHKFIWVVEKSKVIPGDKTKKEEDQTITDAKAVPFGIALPLFKADGSVNNEIHVYPKNTIAKEPKVDKDFKGFENANQDRNEITNNIHEEHQVGDKIDYAIETIIPAGANYETAKWTDQMTEGLTFNTDDENKLSIKIGAKGSEQNLQSGDYTLTEDGNGFKLELTTSGLTKINGQEKETRIWIVYSATLNGNTKIQRQERNDVMFHYGKKQEHSNTPKPTKPTNGVLKVTKSFPNVQGGWAEGETVEVELYDAHTGKVVTDLPDNQNAKQTLTKTQQSWEWHGLDNSRQYKVKEVFKAGNEAEYGIDDNGNITIKNYKNDIPGPKDPQEPAVVTYGHRFQKVDEKSGEGLVGAKFVIENNIENDANKGKVLAKKTAEEQDQDQATYAQKENAYKDKIADGKNADKEKKARDEAYEAANTQWKWIDKDGDKYKGAYVFESQSNGYFKVTGIKTGAYNLIETDAPKGYAKLTAPVPFTVVKDSKGVTTKLDSGKLEDKNGFSQINNKPVIIPQTGGIGSLIFIVAGLAIMTVAFVAMKKRNAVNA